MTKDQLKSLGPGDIIKHRSIPDAALVTTNYTDHVIAIRTYSVYNADEWDLIQKADWNKQENIK